ncbi:MAG: hypothetical protein J5546_00935, partial [Lachnospiraceae bacterium]|nr:hypothetical protein [Lachnospiraceae bacterium]
MLRTWLGLSFVLLWLELIYHLSGFGFHFSNPLFTIFVALTWGAVETLVLLPLRKKAKRIVFFVFLWWSTLWTIAQITYLHIFKQPMLWEAIFTGGQDALTNYWREALTGFLQVSPYVVLCVIPAVCCGILAKKRRLPLPKMNSLRFMRCLVAVVACVFACVINM